MKKLKEIIELIYILCQFLFIILGANFLITKIIYTLYHPELTQTQLTMCFKHFLWDFN
jgi:hypothetical protein